MGGVDQNQTRSASYPINLNATTYSSQKSSHNNSIGISYMDTTVSAEAKYKFN